MDCIDALVKGKKDRHLYCIAPHSKELTTEALWCGSLSIHTANTPRLLQLD